MYGVDPLERLGAAVDGQLKLLEREVRGSVADACGRCIRSQNAPPPLRPKGSIRPAR